MRAALFGVLVLLFSALPAQASLRASSTYVSMRASPRSTDYRSISVTNTGSDPVRVQITLFGGSVFSYSGFCQGELQPRQSCNISLRFRPDRVGMYSAALNVSDSTGDTVRVSLNGTAR